MIIFRKLLLLCTVIIIYGTIVYAQTLYRGGSDTKKQIDTCKYAVTYTFKYIEDTIKKELYYDRQILEVGNKYSHFGSIWADKVDSVWYNTGINAKINRPNKDGSDGISPEKEAGLQANEKPKYEDYYTNYPDKGNLTASIAIEFYEYRYTEPVPKFEWKIQSDTATILGYKCIKATTTFRGRIYDAWFAPFIPVRQGPWKFSGLPGLILKTADTKGYFEWTAIGIEKPQNRYIYIHELDKREMVFTNRKDVLRLQRKQWENYAELLKIQSAAQGRKVVFITKDGRINTTNMEIYNRPYIPIPELE
jgi:GLPGLI family protein